MHISMENLAVLGEAPTLSPLIEHREKNHMHTAPVSQGISCISLSPQPGRSLWPFVWDSGHTQTQTHTHTHTHTHPVASPYGPWIIHKASESIIHTNQRPNTLLIVQAGGMKRERRLTEGKGIWVNLTIGSINTSFILNENKNNHHKEPRERKSLSLS